MTYPKAMLNYMQNYGKHFSKKMYEFAVSNMWKKDPNGNKERMKPMSLEEFNAFMKANGIDLKNNTLYDGAFVLSKAKSLFLGKSIADDMHLAMYVRDYIDDEDAVDGQVFNRWFSDCMLKGMPISWEDVL